MEDFNPQDIVDLQTPKIDLPKEQPIKEVYQSILNKVENKVDFSQPSRFSKSSVFNIGETSKKSLETRQYDIEDAYAQLSDGSYVAKFDTYKAGIDNNEYQAQRQSTGEKWANGGIKFLDKTFNAILGGTVGVVYGLGAALNDGSMSAIYDNNFSNYLNDIDTKLNYQLPNYYKKQDEQAGVFGQMSQANFWADKFLGGLAFTTGAIASEAIWDVATGGTSAGTGLARLANKFGKAERTVNITSKVAQAERFGIEAIGEAKAIEGLAGYKKFIIPELGASYQAGKQSKQLAIIAGKAGEILSIAGRTARSAGYEASVEALQYKKEAESNFYRNFTQEYGREPNSQEIKEFETNNNSAANAVFGVNMGIVGLSNFIGLGHVLNIKNPVNLGISEFINKKAFGFGLDKATNTVLKASTKQKIARGVFDYVVKPGFTEGLFEEGLQGVTNKTANKWIEHSYSAKNTNQTFDVLDDFYDSMQEQYGTEKGWKDNILGIMIGLAGGSINVSSANKAKEAELDYESSVAKTFNGETLQKLILPSKIQSANRIQAFTETSKIENDKGNFTNSQLAKESALASFINAKLVLGSNIKDIVTEMKNTFDNVSESQWKDAGIEQDQIEQYKTDTLNDFESLATEWKTNKAYWKYMVGSKIAGEQNLASTALENGLGSNFSKNAEIIEALTYTSTIGERASGIMESIKNKIASEVGDEYSNTISLIGDLKNSDTEVRKRVKRIDVQHTTITTRREQLLKRIEKLNSAPKLETEANVNQKNDLLRLSQELLDVEAKLLEIKQEAEEIAENLNSAKRYKDNLNEGQIGGNLQGQVFTGEDLLRINKDISKFKASLDYQKTVNPKRYEYLEDLLSEYGQAQNMFMQSQAQQKAVLSDDFKMENIEGYLRGKMSKNKEMKIGTKEWLEQTLKTYSANKTTNISDQLEKVEEVEIEQDVVEKTEEEIILENIQTKEKAEEEINQEKITELENERQTKINALLNVVDEPLEEKSEKITEISRDIRLLERKIEELNQKTLELGIEQDTDPLVDEFARENNNGELDFKKVTFQGRDVVIYQTNQDDKWQGKGSSFKQTWSVLKFNQSFANMDSPAHVRILMTAEQKSNYDKNEKTGFSQELRDLAKNNRNNNTVILIDIRPIRYNIENINKEQKGIENQIKFNQDLIEQKKEALQIIKEKQDQIKTDKTKEEIIAEINEEYDSKIEALKPQIKSTTIEEYKERINTLITGLYKDLRNLPKNAEDLSESKPTKQEIDQYRQLKKENKQNTKEGRELRRKLQDWKILATSVDYDYTSIAELLDLVDQLEEEKQEVETKDRITEEDIDTMFSDIKGSGSDNAKNQLINTNANATVKFNDKGKVELTHIKAQYLIDQLAKPYIITRKGKIVQIDLDNLEVGDLIDIDGMTIEFDFGARLKIDIDDFKSRQQVLNLYVRDTKTTSWNFIDLYSVINGEERKTPSQFRDELVRDEKTYNSKQGDTLTLHVDNTDGWNSTEKGNNEENFKIYLKDKAGNIIQTLKAGYTKTETAVDPTFLNIRKVAYERWEKAGKPDKMDLDISVEVDNIFLGSTEVLFQDNKMIEGKISQEAVDKVIIGKGFILNGEFTLDTIKTFDKDSVNKTYVGAISKKNPDKKIPVIIFKKGVHNIAYPITMVKTGEPINFESLLVGTPQEIVLKINQAIIENKIDTQKLGFEDVVIDGYSAEVLLSDKAEKTKKDFEENQVFVTADKISEKNYKKENLSVDATIRIDLDNLDQVISSPKLRIKLDETVTGLENLIDNTIEKFSLNNEQLLTNIEEVSDGLNKLEEC